MRFCRWSSRMRHSDLITGQSAVDFVGKVRKYLAEAQGATTESQPLTQYLIKLLAKHSLPFATVARNGDLRCPKCRKAIPPRWNDVDYPMWCEDVVESNRIRGLDGQTVYAGGGDNRDGEGRGRVLCGCGLEFALPEGYALEWR